MKLKIEFLYFNKATCERCKTTDENIKKTLTDLKDILKKSNVKFELKEKRLDEKNLKRSPTILINGEDIEKIVNRTEQKTASECSCCSQITGKASDCRSYMYKGKKCDFIPKKMIEKAIELSLKK